MADSTPGADRIAVMPAFEPLLDSNQAAVVLKIHPKTLQGMARRGENAAIHIGKRWRFRASALNECLESKQASLAHQEPPIPPRVGRSSSW
ncbi:MAG: helix-turn-helix domain-containing protein [Terriglobales bacterium]